MQYKLLLLVIAGTLSVEMRGASPQHPGETDGSIGEPPRPARNRRLTVRLYDYADLRPAALERTRRTASRALATAGIEVRWEQCSTSDKDTYQDASCAQRAGAHVIQLRIHPREMSRKLTRRSIEFGYSVPLEDGFGIIAGVYVDRTSEMARSLGLDLHVVLGHTIAHEVGHLLLGTNSHANRGIMRPTWSDREVRFAITGLLGFTEAQARRIQTQVARRLELEATSGNRDGKP